MLDYYLDPYLMYRARPWLIGAGVVLLGLMIFALYTWWPFGIVDDETQTAGLSSPPRHQSDIAARDTALSATRTAPATRHNYRSRNNSWNRNTIERLQQAKSELRAGNYAHAYVIWQELANADNPEAQHNLGWMYHNGYGVAPNDEQAVVWWELAAGHGNIEASFDLGNLYYQGGKGVSRDYQLASYWFGLAAESGHQEAREVLASLLKKNHPAVQQRRESVETAIGIRGIRDSYNSDILQVTGNRANLRDAPTTEGRKVRTLPKGTVLTRIEQKDDWVYVLLMDTGEAAWIHNSLVSNAQLN